MLPCKQLGISSTQHSSSREASRINTPRSTLGGESEYRGFAGKKKRVNRNRRGESALSLQITIAEWALALACDLWPGLCG